MKVLLSATYPFIYLLLFFAIPFDNYFRVFPNILLALLVFSFPFVVCKEDFKKLRKVPTVLFLFFIAVLCLLSLASGRFDSDSVIIQKVGLAILFAILYIPVKDFRKIKLTIILSSLAVIVFSVIKILIIIYTSEEIVLGYSREVVESLLIDRIYIGLLSILSILVSYQSLSKVYHPNNKYHLVNIIINLLFLLLMVSKVALLVLAIIVLVRQLYSKKKVFRYVGALMLLAATITAIGLISKSVKSPNQQAQSSFLQNTLTWEMRTTVWENASHIISSNPLLINGFGYKGTKEKLVASYGSRIKEKQKQARFVANRYNSHNQFLDFYLSFGVFAVSLFTGVLLLLLYKNKKYFLPTSFLIVVICFCLVENVFHRQIGAYYIGFVLTALLVKNSFMLPSNDSPKDTQ